MKILCVTLIEYSQNIPPLGSPYINGALKSSGFDSDIMFIFVESDSSGTSIVTDDTSRNISAASIITAVSGIEAYSPDVVAFSCYNYNRESTAQVAMQLKQRQPGIIQIAGGPDINPFLYDISGFDIHKDHMDFLVMGEGERIITSIVSELQQGDKYLKLQGVFTCSRTEENDFDKRQYNIIDDLDTLPFPDFGENPRFEKFLDHNNWWAGIPINTSRGCTGNCSFCDVIKIRKGIRFRNGEKIFQEIVYQMEKYGVDKFMIIDDDPLSRPALKEVGRFINLLIKHSQKYSWTIYNSRVDSVLADPKWAQLLKKAGLEKVQFGVESFSPNVKKHMAKSPSPEITDKVLRNFSSAGVSTEIYLIYGYPAETEEDFQMTLDWLSDNGNIISGINANIFILNKAYEAKRPGSFKRREHRPGEPFSYWESEQVNPDVMWVRFNRMKELFEKQDGFYYSIASPTGEYLTNEDKARPSKIKKALTRFLKR